MLLTIFLILKKKKSVFSVEENFSDKVHVMFVYVYQLDRKRFPLSSWSFWVCLHIAGVVRLS